MRPSFVLRASSFIRHSPFAIRHFLLATLLGSLPAHAHPLQAEPIDHAYVFNFDQFNLPEDPDEHLVNGGLLLLAELNCTACHEVPKAWQERLKSKPAPDLSAVGSRLDEDTLWLMIRSPQHRKKGTQMPGLFAGEEGDDEKVEALVEYLASLKAETPKTPAGDAEPGGERLQQDRHPSAAKSFITKSAAWPATSPRSMFGLPKCPLMPRSTNPAMPPCPSLWPMRMN